MKTEKLSANDIEQLQKQGCTAADWASVLVAPGIELGRIRNAHFSGTVVLGSNSGTVAIGGVALACGIYDATLADCVIGSGVRIANVRTLLAEYDIDDAACIQDVGMMVSESGATFGNGEEVESVNEAGGRGTVIYNRLTAQVAYLNAMHRHDAGFMAALRKLIDAECAASTPKRGRVGRAAQVIGCGSIRNVIVGPYAHLEGSAVLQDGTVNSCEEHPTFLGNSVYARHFIVAEGARIDSGAIVDKGFVGQGVKMGKQYSAENSLFFANCEAYHGEGVALFAGPYTVTHHKSTLMIAGLFSFYNAGSGTNQSNHMYKLGPVHQGVFERGCKTGSFSYVLYESHVGAFSVVIGKHFTNIRTPNLPFSNISEKGGESTIVPGMNLFSVGMVRDGEKWPKRDNRQARDKRDLIIFDVFSPFTVERMRRGRDELLALNEITSKDRLTVNVGGVQMNRALLRKGAKYYSSAIVRYIVDRVAERLGGALQATPGWGAATASLKPRTTLRQASEWMDLCGLLTPSELVRDLEDRVKEGKIKSYDELLTALAHLFDSYREYEWQYVFETFEKEFGYKLSSVPKEQLLKILEEWKKAAQTIHTAILEDSKKEFGPASKLGYGVDQGEAETEADFTAVRGTLDGNAVVQKLTKEGEAIVRRYEEMRAMLESAAG
jgi:Domain of unknown function (DUF4954)/Domain of unknown function (DUF6819)